ncbi:Exocyst complex protein EXO70 [Ceratocystis lukuohia]|uniref:Exocyst complex protein EXO70 n=1 Tax=Ceratocystis lukuohia TaxID=2019550 RepID=A0ABR4MFS7_9PEZI
MAVGLNTGRNVADEEARAEVDVLNSRLEKTTQLTKKIQACLGRLEATGKSVRDVAGPLSGETRKLQVLDANVDGMIAAIGRLRQSVDSKNDEEALIRSGPEKVGLAPYLASIKRLAQSASEMQTSNIRANQQAMSDLLRLVNFGNSMLESYFQKLLQIDTPSAIEPLQNITKSKPFPLLPQESMARLGLITDYMTTQRKQSNASVAPHDASVGRIFVDTRGPYLTSSLSNLAMASVNTAKKQNPDTVYRAGTNAIGSYAKAIEGMLLAEYDNICNLFPREDWGSLFQAVCQPALADLARTIRDLNTHIKMHLAFDCFLSYEITGIMAMLTTKLEERTGDVIKSSLASALKPVRETAKTSLAELLEHMKRSIANIQTLPSDGALVPIVPEVVQRLQAMLDFINPLSSIMVSLGDGGWKQSAKTPAPSLASFDIGADGREIFADYCVDTIETLLTSLVQKSRITHKGKAIQGVFLANCVITIDRSVQESDLKPLLGARASVLEQWRKRAVSLYVDSCKDISMHLFDVIHTNRSARPTSGPSDSASAVKGLSAKDRDNIKSKFAAFNASFDEMVARHRACNMDPQVRKMFAQAVQQMLEPLYNRFWDRYHEIDKGRGKHVKFDKVTMAQTFDSLYT